MNETPTASQDNAIGRNHEPDTVNWRLVVLSSVGLVLLVASVLLLMHETLLLFESQEQTTSQASPVVRRTRTASGPLFTSAQPEQLRELRQAENRRLNNYEWIDEPAGVARIPIERAIDILAERGLTMAQSGSEQQDDDKSN